MIRDTKLSNKCSGFTCRDHRLEDLFEEIW